MTSRARRRWISRKSLPYSVQPEPYSGESRSLPIARRTAGRGSVSAGLKAGVSTIAIGMLASFTGAGVLRAQQATVAVPSVNVPSVNIVADGRTRTTITTVGNQTGITTATISNNTAFNSFSSFKQGIGSTVNLYLPNATGNLVNIVSGGSVVVDGVLNSYKDGRIGGNVFFSDSQGFIVGQSGVVNVGSLTVNTPTQKFLDTVIGANGSVNDAAAGRLMRNDVPLSFDGFVSISGKINAQGGISLNGQSIMLTGPTGAPITGKDLTQRQRFQATVNTTGLTEGGAMISRNGVISIVAAGTVHVGGRIKTGATASGMGGKIVVKSGGDTVLASSARLSADGSGSHGAGGEIKVVAGATLTARTGAGISVHGAGTGAGGFVELSGKVAHIGGLRYDLGSDGGVAGALLIDPINLIIDAAGSQVTGGGLVTLQADNSITVAGDGVIDTTNTGGAAGDITLQAPSITLADGAILNAAATGGFAAGTVTLEATRTGNGTAQIVIGAATVSGGNIDFLATATAGAPTLLVSTPNAHATISITGATITASGALQAHATAASATGTILLPIGIVVTDVAASVDVLGTATIQAASADLKAIATATNDVKTQSLVPANSRADGAVAVSTLTSSAQTHIGDSANLTIAGALGLTSSNTIISHADATPVGAAFGASVAVSVVTATTGTNIDGNAVIGAGSLVVSATTSSDITAIAGATAGGATAPAAGSKADEYLSDPKYAGAESTSEGKVSVVGAFALSDLTSTTLSAMSSSAAATVAGAVSIGALTNNSVIVTADGSAVDSNVGVGVALGINLAKVRNDATVSQSVTAASLALDARMFGSAGHNSFTTSATSGAGGASVGVAGSLAVNLVDTQSVATIAPTANVTITGNGAVSVTAGDKTVSSASAVPDTTGATGGKIGVGASVAINIVANRTTALVGDGAIVTAPGSITLSADSVHEIITMAKAGSSGGISLTPALALSLVNNTTTAKLGTGAIQHVAGNVKVATSQQASEDTTASGEAAGSKAAIGAAVAIALVNDTVTATTLRDINATGAVTFRAWGASSSTLEAKASASGGKEADSSGNAETGQDSNVDTTVSKNLTDASTKQSDNGVGNSEQQSASANGAADESGRSASSGEGKVNVAAAVGVNVQNARVFAGVPDGVNITAGGALTVATANNTIGKVSADGSAVGTDGASAAAVGIGAAVAVNVVHSRNDATLGNGSVTAGSVDVSALKLDVGALVAGSSADPVSDIYLARAKSGAGGSNVGIAGSLALNLVDTQSMATVAGGAQLTLTGGGLSLASDDRSTTTASALPDETGATGGKVGIGASVAINILANRSTAALGDAATLGGAGAISLSANAVHVITTEAEAGAEGGFAITPVVALALVNNTTTAQLGTLTSGAQGAGGAVSITAIQQASATTTAKGQAKGGTAAVGAALALNLVNDTVTATTKRSINATGDVTFRAMGASFGMLTAEASASGAAAADSNGDAPAGEDSSVDSKVGGQLTSASGKQNASGVGDAKQKADTGSSASGDHSAKTSQGKVSVAAAVGVNIQKSTVIASVPDAVDITSGGTLTVASTTNTDGQVTTNASAVGEDGAQSQIGIGAAVSVNVVHGVNDATLGTATHDVKGLTISASKLDVAAYAADSSSTATRQDVYLASATSGAGGSSVGVAGSLGLNLVDTQSVASISDAANVTAAGVVSITADNKTKETAKALPVEGTIGGKIGIGASVAINIVANRSLARVGDGAALKDAEELTIRATADHEIETEAEAGAEGGIGLVPVLALTIAANTTSATLGSFATPLNVAGSVEIAAEQAAAETTNASAKAAGEKVAIGAALSLALITDKARVSTGRAITTTNSGNVTFAASGTSIGNLTVSAGAKGAKAADSNDKATDGGGDSVDKKADNQFAFGKSTQTSSGVGDSKQQAGTESTSSKGHSAKSSEGKLSVAAAIGVNVVTSSVSAEMPDGLNINAAGRLSVTATNGTDGTVSADASASGSAIGIAAAAAVNAITETNIASLGAATYSGNGVTVTALKGPVGTPHVDTFSTTAKAGAGGTNIGIAGALALNLVNASSVATVSGSAIVDAGTAASVISADQRMGASASATPLDDSDTTGGKVGVGASVALNLITTTSKAEITDGAVFANGAGLSVSANSAISTATEAKAGSTGGIAIDAVVALATLDETTTARIGTGTAITTAGAVEISATNSGENTATGSGKAKGGSVGVGAAVAVIIGSGDMGAVLRNTSATSATLARDLTAASLTISATSDRSYEAYATASAGGGKDKKASETGNASSTQNLEKTKGSQKKTKNGGKISVAAAVGIAVAQDAVSATLEDVTVSLGGDMAIAATNTTNIASSGNGAATNSKAKVGVGIGVALSISNNVAAATIADGATITNANAVSVSAITSQNMAHDAGKTDFLNGVAAQAFAGASASKVSVAGAFAIDISSTKTLATVGDNVQIGSIGAVGGVNISADNTSRMAAKAASKSVSTAKVGVGASVAVVVSNNTYTANIGAGTSVNATGVSVTATNQKVTNPSAFSFTDLASLETTIETTPLFGAGNYYTEAIGGAAASKVAVEGSFSVMQFSDSAYAGIGKSLDSTSTAATSVDAGTGNVTIAAHNDFEAKALSGALSLGGKVGVGVSSSVIVSNGSTISELAQNASLGNAGAVATTAGASQKFDVYSISASGGGTAGIAGVATVLTSENTVEALIGLNADIGATGDVAVNAANTFDSVSVAGGLGIGGDAGIGAAASVVTVNNITRAALADGTTTSSGVAIDTAGSVAIGASASETGKTFAVAGGASGEVGVGAGVAVYVLGTTTEALVGNYARIGQGTAVGPLSVTAQDDSTLDTYPGAVGVGGSVGAGAGVGVGTLTKTVTASIGDFAAVGAQDVLVSAKSSEIADMIAIAAGVGGDAGLAGAVTVYTITDTTTASIGASASVFAANNVAVLANDLTQVDTIAGNVAIGGSAGIGASIGIVIIDNTTRAIIADLAKVTALGGGAGVGYTKRYDTSFTSFADNFKGPDVSDAGISGTATGVNEVGLTSGDATDTGLSLLTKTRNSLPISAVAHGVVVNAAASNRVRSVEIGGAAAGSAAISLSGNVPIIAADTQATIGAAEINKMAGPANAAQGVTVAAASDIYDLGMAGAVAIGGSVGAGAGVSVAVVRNTTKATVANGADMNAAGDIAVTAKAREDFVAAAAAGAVGGSAALAGGVGVIVVTDVTEATLGGKALAGGNVEVLADDQTRAATVAGALAVGVGAAGAGAGISVLTVKKATTADIAASADVTALGGGSGTFGAYTGANMTSTASVRGINVAATSGESSLTIAVSAAGGLYAGLSGVVSIDLMDVTTSATIGTNARINQDGAQTSANSGQDVVVTARDTSVTNVFDGALAAGAVGLAGSVDVGVIKTTTSATIGNGVVMAAKKDVLVNALSNKAGNATVISGSLGVVSIAAGIAIYDYGNGITPGGEADDKLGKASNGNVKLSDITGQASGQTKDGGGNGVSGLIGGSSNSYVAQASTSAQAKRQTVDLSVAPTLSVPAGTSANVGSATITAGGTLNLQSRDNLHSNLVTGAASAGVVGLGAGVAVVSVDTTNTAQLSGAAQITATNFGANAFTVHSIDGSGNAGAAGGFGAAAAVSVLSDNSDTYAYVNGATLTVSGGVAVNVGSTRTVTSHARGVAFGISGAGGLALADTTVGGDTKAGLGKNVSGTAAAGGVTIGNAGAKAASVTITATSGDTVESKTLAAAGGLGVALQGSVALAKLATTVSTDINAADIYATGAITDSATAMNTANSDAIGYAVSGGLAAGVSLSHSSLGAQVATNVGGASNLTGGSLGIEARIAGSGVTSNAEASSGALIGVAGSDSRSTNTSTAVAAVNGSGINTTGLAQITANGITNQNATTTGLAIGIVGIGSNYSEATSNTVTRAYLYDMTGVTAGGLNIKATGADTNTASSVAGSGGVIAGAASKAVTRTTSTTQAYADTSDLAHKYLINATNSTVEIGAVHTSTFGGSVDSTQASLVGASGATLEHTVNATVNAYLGDNAYLRAADLSIFARNIVHNFFIGETAYDLYPGGTANSGYDGDNAGWNVNSGSGGLLNLPAGSSTVNITQTTAATIGSSVDVRLLLPTASLSALTIEAYNELIAHQKSKLDSAGLIATAASSVKMTGVQTATVTLGSDSAIVVDLGDIHISAWGNADMDGRSAATTYGLAGAPSGNADALLNVTNTVGLGNNVRLAATNGIDPADGSTPTNGTITIAAGEGLAGDRSNIDLHTTLDFFNNAAIPISANPNPKADLIANATVTQGTTSDETVTPLIGIVAAGDITISADRGDISLSAVGTGKDIYREALAKIASAVSNLFGGGDISFDYHGGSTSNSGATALTLNGLVATGLQRNKSLTLNYGSGCDPTLAGCITSTGQIGYGIQTLTADNSVIIQRLNQLQLLIDNTRGDTVAKGAYASEILFLQQKLVGLGLGAFDGSGNFSLVPYASGKSEFDILTAEKAAAQQSLDNLSAQFSAQALVVNVGTATAIAGDFDNGTANDFKSFATSVRSTITTLGKYTNITTPRIPDTSSGAPAGATVPNPAYNPSFVNTFNGINIKLGAAAGYRLTINTKISSNNTLQTQIDAQISIINNPASTAGQVTAAKTAMTTKLGQVKANNTTIKTASDSLNTKLASIKTDLTNLVNTAKTGADATTVTNLNRVGTASVIGGALWAVGVGQADVNGLAGTLGTLNTSVSDKINVLNGVAPVSGAYSIDTFSTAATGFTGRINTADAALPTASHTPATAPTTLLVTVDDVAARLGNIYLNGGNVTGGGTGILSAPGDATILITNNTAATLKVGNITMPSYDAGHVRVNGVLVNSPDDVAGFAPTGSARFAKVLTGLTSSRPIVTLASNYNPNSAAFFSATGSEQWQRTRLAPPDIIVNGIIQNPNGAVNITSAYGNIFVYGAINAGSVNILAKNGDFVSSFVNGFDHIGGDPAAFNSPTTAAEAGTGITANGAIAISARYLNINSTIQSGIANWDVTLGATPTLTALNPAQIGVTSAQITNAFTTYRNALTAAVTPSSVATTANLTSLSGQTITLNMNPTGLNQSDLQTAIKGYQAAIVLDPATNPMYAIRATGGGENKLINIKDFISGTGIVPRLEFSVGKANAYKTSQGTTGLIYQVVNAGNIGVSYDVDNAQYMVDGTEAHGGYIQLYGQILNTASRGGRLNVLDGFGTINVTNNSGVALVLSTLDAGSDTTGTAGRGTAGVIDITDITKVTVDTANPATPSTVDIKHTVYTRDYVPGATSGQIMVATQTGHIDTVTGLPVYTGGSATAVGAGVDRITSYATTANQRYIWTTAEKYDLKVSVTTKDEQLFGSSALTISSTTSFNSVGAATKLSEGRLAEGTYLSTSQTPTGTTQFINGSNGQPAILITDTNYTPVANSSISSPALVEGDFSFRTGFTYDQTGQSSRSCNWWTLCIDSTVTTTYSLDQKYTTIKTHSLKADNPIAINFIGANTGAVNVASQSDVTLTGQVTAKSGSVTIGATGGTHSIISANNGAVVTGTDITLNAAGYIGGNGKPAVQLAMPGADNGIGGLEANAGAGNVLLNAANGLRVKKVTAAGNVTGGQGIVNLTVGTNLTATPAGYIEAPRVILSAANGTIGSTATPMLVNTGFSAAGRSFGDPAIDPTLDANPYYGLSALAADDIGIRSAAWSGNSDGTILVDQVVSKGGNVLLDATGQILDNNPVQTVDTRTYTQLLGYWTSLGLLDGTENTAKVALAITGYENGKTADYNQYWQIRQSQADGGAVYDSGFNVTIAAGSQKYQGLSAYYTPIVKAANPGYTPQQVADAVALKIGTYAAEQTTKYHALNTGVGGLTATFDNSYAYQVSTDPTDPERAKLTRGSVWSERQLAFALSPGALKTVTGTNPVRKAPNVSGRTVTLNADNGIGETVGAGTGSLGVSIPADILPANLTPAQKIALASAERPDLQLIVTAITLPTSPTQQQQDEFDAAQALGILTTSTVIPLGTNFEDMTPTEQAALNAAADHLVAASDLTIRVLNKRPLNFDAKTALNVAVTATPGSTGDLGKAYLSSRGLGLLDSISVIGETRIKTQGPIANVGSGIVSTGNLVLESAQGGIGTGLDPFDTSHHFSPMRISPRTNATITARAQGAISLEVTGQANVDTIYSPGNITVASTGAILNANHDLLINILGTDVILGATPGNIGAAGNALNVGVNFGGGITAAAPAGAIYLYGPASNAFVVTSALTPNGISLGADNEAVINGPVTTAGPIKLTTGGLLALTGNAAVSTSAGNVIATLGSMQMFNGATIGTPTGTVDITTNVGDALVTGITSAGQVTITAAGHVLAGTDPNRVDITTTGAGALVKIVSGLGIGDETKVNSPSLTWPYDGTDVANPITQIANRLIIKTGKIDLYAAKGDINAHTLLDITDAKLVADTGSIDITGDGGFYTRLMTAGGGASIVAVGDLKADTVVAGSVVPAIGAVHLETKGALDVGTSTSTGTQTWLAVNDVTFTQVTTSGALPTDPGDVNITSTDGAINGGSIDAAGTVRLNGNGILFDSITAGVDAIFVSSKDIFGTTLIAGNAVDLIAGSNTYAGDIKINTVTAKTMSFDATGILNLPDLKVAQSVILRGGTVSAGITQVPSGPDPLKLTLTGGRKTVGTLANVTVDAPAGLAIDDLWFVDTTLGTTAKVVTIANAYVPGSLLLTSPLQKLLFDDRTPAPHYSANVQFFQPTFGFHLSLDHYYSISNAYTVQYNVSPDSADKLIQLDFNGAGLVRDTIRVMRNGEDWGTGPGSIYWLFDAHPPLGSTLYIDGKDLVIDGQAYSVDWTDGQVSAVQLGNN